MPCDATREIDAVSPCSRLRSQRELVGPYLPDVCTLKFPTL